MQALLEILYTNNLSKSYKEPVRYTSVALCAVGTSVIFALPPYLRDSVCPLYKPFSSSSIFERTSYYPVTVSLITLLPCLLLPCYHVSYYPVPCLEYPVTMSSITLLPCLLLLCLMYSITLSHVFHYPVSCLPLPCLMSSITLSPSRNAKSQKKS